MISFGTTTCNNSVTSLCSNISATKEMINFLLENDGDPNLKDSNQNLPIHFASKNEKIDEELNC